MAYDKAIDASRLDADLASVADAIRTKSGTAGVLAFPDGFVNAVNNMAGSSSGNAVLHIAQTLTDEQKAQARANIEAASTADIPTIDPTLTVEGSAADAKAVGEELGEKAPKLMIVAIKKYQGGTESPHSDYSADEIIAHIQNGGIALCSYSDYPSGEINYYCTLENYTTGDAPAVTFSKLHLWSTSVYRFNYIVNSDKSVTLSDESYMAQIENCTAKVGQIARVKEINYMGHPNAWEAVDMPKTAAVADAAGDTPTAEEFNALLAALRNAGLMATE